MTKDEFQVIIVQRLPESQCQVLEYTASREKCSIQCLKCNRIITRTRADSFLQRARDGFVDVCHYCDSTSEKNQLKQDIRKRIINLNPNIECLNLNFKNRSEKIQWHCRNCNRDFEKTPSAFINNPKCPHCEQTRIVKLTIDVIKMRTLEEWGDEYEVLSETYSGKRHDSNKILVRHNACGFCWSVNVFNFLQKHKGCPRCAASLPEKTIRQWLNNHSFTCDEQVPVSYEGHRFRFDFKINNTFLEYHGDQHYQPVPKWGGQAALEKRQHYDNLKAQYCAINNIPLIILQGNPSDSLNEELAQRLHSQAA